MSIAATVAACLVRHRVPYAVISHRAAAGYRDKAAAASVSPARLAKAVLLRDRRGYVLAVIPSDRTLALDQAVRLLGRDLREADPADARRCFKDCDEGAVPPLGPGYAIPTVVDEELLTQRQICFVPGSHDALVCVDRNDFLALLPGSRRGYIAAPLLAPQVAFPSECEPAAALVPQ